MMASRWPRVTAAPGRHQHLEHLAVHGRAYQAALPLIRGVIERKIAQSHLGLAAATQHVDSVRVGDGDGVICRRRAIDRNLGTGRRIVDLRHDVLPVDQQRQRQPARAGKLEAIVSVPGRWRPIHIARRVEAGRFAGQQLHGASRGSGTVETLARPGKRGEMGIDEAGVEIAGAEHGCAAERSQEGGIAARAGDNRRLQRLGQAIEGFLAGRRMRDQLGDHRIVEGRHLVARLHAGIDPRPRRELQRDQPAGRGQKTARGIFGVKPCLHGVTLEPQLVLFERQGFAGRHAELPFHQVQARDALRHRVLDLQPGVHLHEPEAALLQPVCAVGDELDGAGALVSNRAGGGDGGFAHLSAQALAHARRRRLLDHLLVAALQRAVALAQVDDIAVAVAEDLELDVARARHVFLDHHPGVAEGTLRLTHAGGERIVEVGVAVDPAHALAAAAGHGLDQHRIADLVGLALEEGRLLPLAMIAGHHRHAGFFHQGLGAVLEAHGADRGRRRPDEGKAGVEAALREIGVFREEAVAGMDAVGLRFFCRRDQLVDGKIALRRRRRPDFNRRVGAFHMQRIAISLGIDRDRAQAQTLGGAHDAAGDLAAIGDKDGGEHQRPWSMAAL